MKRRILYYDKRGVSNVVAYSFAFSIATMVMVSSVYITNGIVENKTAQIAGLQAQSIANKIAYGVVEAIVSRQSNPGLNYTKTLDIPLNLAGLSYYIDITDTAVYVNTTNGQVSKSCSTYNTGDLNIGISTGRIGGSSKIDIHYKEPDYVYKFDFGTGDITSHSPVESGYYIVSPDAGPDWFDNNYPYRIPINVSNPSSENLTDVPVKIVLNTGNFDYSHANVTIASSSWVSSDIVFCNDTHPSGDIPYYIDYWNPEGESVILVNMTLKNYSYEHIYLYYGGSSLGNYDISKVSMFFDDFEGTVLSEEWGGSSPGLDGFGNVTLNDGEYIYTNNFEIPLIETPDPLTESINVSEAMYIVEAKMQIKNDGQGNMILLSQDGYIAGCYLVSANFTPYGKLLIQKIVPDTQELKNVSVPDLNHWLRLKSYIYLSDTCYPGGSHTNATLIKGYLYNFTTFAYKGNISGLDTWYYNGESGDPDDDDATGAPYLEGNIGLGCGLFGSELGDVIVDWIRVMKTPTNPPTVSIGPIESIKYNWSGTVNAGIKYNASNPFDPGPVLSDFNSHPSEDRTFEIQDLPEDDYTITVTMGKYNDICEAMSIYVGSESNPRVTIPATELGKFETKWFPLDWNGGNLELKFSSTGTWTVNSIIIERGEKGIKVTER